MKNSAYLLICCLFLFSCNSNEFRSIDIADPCAWNIHGKATCNNEELVLVDSEARVVTTSAYKNFILELEVKTDENAIGAILFHTDGFGSHTDGYEVLLNNNKESDEWRKTGSLSTVLNIEKCVAENNAWTPIRIEVADKNIRIYVNELSVVDYTEPQQPYRTKENAKRVLNDGVFMFCNYSNSPIAFRDIKVKTLPNNLHNRSNAPDEQNDDIIKLSTI